MRLLYELNGRMYMSCGCVARKQEGKFIVDACRDGPNCEFVKFCERETVGQGKPVIEKRF